MWLDVEWHDCGEWWLWREWPEWFLVEPTDSEPCLFARYSNGEEVGPYPVVLPR